MTKRKWQSRRKPKYKPQEQWESCDKIGSKILWLRLRTQEVELCRDGGGAIAIAAELRRQIISLGEQRRAVLRHARELAETYQQDKQLLVRLSHTKRLMRKYRLPYVSAWNCVLEIERKLGVTQHES